MATKQARIANDISGADGLWKQATRKLAEDCPHYQKAGGEPNFYQITTAAKKLGYDEIDATNLAQVIQELKDRVTAPEPEPEQPEPPDPQTGDEPAYQEPLPVPDLEVNATSGESTFSIKCFDPDGYDVLVAIRDTDGKSLMERGAGLLAYVKAHGYSPLPPRYGNGQANRPAPATAPAAGGNGSGEPLEVFYPTEIKFADRTDKGAIRCVCKGDPYHVHGVSIFEERIPDELLELVNQDPTRPHKIEGWKATCTLQEKRDGTGLTPNKVIKLEKAA